MSIYTMGFTQKSAEEFFRLIIDNRIKLLVDIRLNNQSQLAGFTKGKDLEYFLRTIAGCRYVHELLYAPSKELLNGYKKGDISWDEYTKVYSALIRDRKMTEHFRKHYLSNDNVVLLCSEPTPEKCHRRLLGEALKTACSTELIHI